MKFKMQSESGKTLSELLVVVAIIGLLSAIFLPILLGFVEKTKLESTIFQLEAWLRETQYDAITGDGIKTVCIDKDKIAKAENNDCVSVKQWTPITGKLDQANSTFSTSQDVAGFTTNGILKVSFKNEVNGAQLGRVTLTSRRLNEKVSEANTVCLFQVLKDGETKIERRNGIRCIK
jgi:Tfp pilus assembly protein FimT